MMSCASLSAAAWEATRMSSTERSVAVTRNAFRSGTVWTQGSHEPATVPTRIPPDPGPARLRRPVSPARARCVVLAEDDRDVGVRRARALDDQLGRQAERLGDLL